MSKNSKELDIITELNTHLKWLKNLDYSENKELQKEPKEHPYRRHIKLQWKINKFR